MILIVAAMLEELNALKMLGDNVASRVVSDISVVEMELANQKVVLCLSGVGKVNAAYTTATLCEIYDFKMIINIGSAGGLQENQRVGDIVIADLVRAHDFDIGPNTLTDARFIYRPNLDYAQKAYTIAKNLGYRVHLGEIVSGDQFITHGSEALDRIKTKFADAICVEMEAVAVGAVSKRRDIPFIILRSLSDVPLKTGNELEFEAYLPIASKHSAEITQHFIASMV